MMNVTDYTNIKTLLVKFKEKSDVLYAKAAALSNYATIEWVGTQIPSVGNGTVTIKQNGASKGSFSMNQSGGATINLTDTTYSSLSAVSGGTDKSLVTTGEKYTWNNKQAAISDLATIRSNAATAYGWGDHKMAGYAKPFVITVTRNASTREYEVVDGIDAEEVQNALNAHNLILLKDNDVVMSLTQAFGNVEDGITLQFFSIYGDGNEHSEYIISVYDYEATVDYYDYVYATYSQIESEETERKAADQTLQANIDKKVSKDDEGWLENLMPRIWLNPNGAVGTITVGDSLAVDYADARWRLSKYGGTVTPYDDESVHGRVVQVKDLNDNKLYVTAIFNNGADFSDNYANSLYEIVLNFAANGSFANGTYTVKQMPEIFYFDFYSSGDGYETLTNWKDIVAAHSRGALILGRDEDGSICVPYTYYGDKTNFNTLLSKGPYDDGVITNIEFSWSAAYPNGAVNVYTYNWFDKQDTLVSGTNIKTINGESVLGSGNLKAGLPTIQAGTGANSEVFNGIAPASASGERSHAEGEDSDASGYAAHAEGFSTISAGSNSHAEGNSTEANGDGSHAEGGGSIANGVYSHAEGMNTVAMRQASHAEGTLNVEDDAAIHQVGIGTSAVNKDAHRITYDGKHYILGIGGFDGTKATANFTNEKDLATVINGYETRISALETDLASINSTLYINSSGNVGIGTTSPAYKLDVVGTIRATTGLYTNGYISAKQASASSDRRLKKDFRSIDNALDYVLNTHYTRFRWKDDNKESIGIIAQEEQNREYGFLVQNNEKIGHLTYDYAASTALLGAAIQEEDSKVEKLKKRVAELEKELSNLKRQWQH